MKTKGNIIGFFAAFLTLAYCIYVVCYFYGIIDTGAGMIASVIVMPHMVCVAVASIFAMVGRFAHKRWGMLTAGILLAVSAVLMLSYAPLVIVQLVLCFIAYVRMGKTAA